MGGTRSNLGATLTLHEGRQRFSGPAGKRVEGQRLESPHSSKNALFKHNLQVVAGVSRHLECILLGAYEQRGAVDAHTHKRFAHTRTQHCLGEQHGRCNQ